MQTATLIVAVIAAVGSIYLVTIERGRRRDEVRLSKLADVRVRIKLSPVQRQPTMGEERFVEITNEGRCTAQVC